MGSVLNNKNIVVGITGGIAAYKAAEIVSRLRKEGARVKVIMTENATKFIQPLTLQTLSANPVYCDTFARVERFEVGHVSLAKWADLIVVVPATANILGKVRCGIADDLLSTTIMAARSKVIFAPAMNTAMYRSAAVQENIRVLKERGYGIISPAAGLLACGEEGEGRLAEIDDIIGTIKKHFSRSLDLKGIRVLVTAGPTREYIDPVRFITNPSSGRMGFALARACLERGGEVELVTGPVEITPPPGAVLHRVETAQQMYEKVLELFPRCHIVFKCAAVGDYRPAIRSEHKIKKDAQRITLELVRNPDILKELGRRKSCQILVGFAAETQNIEEYARKKLREKNLDFIFANDVSQPGAGFGVDTNRGVLFTRSGERIDIPLLGKEELAHRLINEIIQRISLEELRKGE